MNATDSRPLRQTSFVLPFVGTLLLLTLVVDFVIQSFSLQWTNPQAKLNFFNEIIDRGVIALIGLTLVYAGFWLNNALNPPVIAEPGNPTASSPLRNPQFWNFVVASLLGLVFLLLLPVHFGASGEIYTAATTQADQREAQIKYQIQQQQQEIQAVLSSGQLDQLLQQKNLPPDRLALLQELKKDPQAFDKKASQQLEEMKKQKQQALDQVGKEVSLVRWRAEVRSFLIALGFIVIGWTGLRDAR